MAKKFPKSALKDIDVIEGRMILHHWAGVPTEEVINLIMPERVLASLEEHQDCFLTGDLNAEFLSHLNPDTVAFLTAVREYMTGERKRVPKRADIAATVELGPGEEPDAGAENEEEEEAATPEPEPEPKPKKEKTMALKTKPLGGKKEAPKPEPAPALDLSELGVHLAGLDAKLEELTVLVEINCRVLTFLVSEGVLDEDTSFDDINDLYEAIVGD